MTENPNDGNALLMGGGTRWVKFPTLGASVTGKVLTEPEKRQQRDFDDASVLLTWPNGDPKWEIVCDIQTDERDPEDDDDTGVRALHIKGYMTDAVRAAVRAAKADGLHIGGVITVTYTSDGESKGRGKPPKMYSAFYVPPLSSGNGSLMGADVPATMPANVPSPLPAPNPAQTFATTTAVPPPPPAPASPPGVDPAMWAAMHSEQQRAVLAAMGIPF